MKIIIFGAKGMLGTDLMQVFDSYKPKGLDLDDVDITDSEALKEKILEISPDLVINAAAYTDVDGCEKNLELAYNVNGRAVGYMAKFCRQIGATLVHYSTDYIFNGQKKEGYDEDDNPDPINVYGQSKLMAEKIISHQTDNFYIIRTAWLYGKNGKNFVETMLELSNKNESPQNGIPSAGEIKVVNDQFGRPTYTKDLAQKTREIIDQKKEFGTYHVTNSGTCSWYEFTKEIFKQKGIKIKVKPIATEEFPRPAKRPNYSIMNNNKLTSLRSWQEALGEYLKNEA